MSHKSPEKEINEAEVSSEPGLSISFLRELSEDEFDGVEQVILAIATVNGLSETTVQNKGSSVFIQCKKLSDVVRVIDTYQSGAWKKDERIPLEITRRTIRGVQRSYRGMSMHIPADQKD